MSKFPKSINNLRCTNKCNDKNTLFIDPFTLDFFVENDNVCPISLLYSNEIFNNINKKKKFMKNKIDNVDFCKKDDKKKEYKKVNYFGPGINVSQKFFFKYIYNFSGIEESINYLYKNDNLHKKTKTRILNSIWDRIYKKEIPDIFIKYYINKYNSSYSFKKMSELVNKFIKENNYIDNIHNKFIEYIK